MRPSSNVLSTRKLMAQHWILQLKANINSLYMRTKNGSRMLININNRIMVERRTLSDYLINSGEDLLQYAGKDMNINADEMMQVEVINQRE